MDALLFLAERVLAIGTLIFRVDLRLLGCADSFIQHAGE